MLLSVISYCRESMKIWSRYSDLSLCIFQTQRAHTQQPGNKESTIYKLTNRSKDCDQLWCIFTFNECKALDFRHLLWHMNFMTVKCSLNVYTMWKIKIKCLLFNVFTITPLTCSSKSIRLASLNSKSCWVSLDYCITCGASCKIIVHYIMWYRRTSL